MLLYFCLHSVGVAEVQEFTLDNGLRLIVSVDQRAPVVVSQIWYKVGGSYESPGKIGISHVLEHMMFKGTQRYAPGEFSRIMAAEGAEENAFTSMDYTAYFQTLEKSRLALSFEMEADRMRYLVLDETEFAKERQVVLEERRTRVEDEPVSILYEHFKATAFQSSPYRQPLGGRQTDIKNITLEDLKTWYQRWYAPNNATLVVVGDVEPQAVLNLAQKYFGDFKSSTITPPTPRPEVEQFGVKRITVKRPAKLPYLIMGYKVPVLNTIAPEDNWEVYALNVLAYLLDGGESARLSKNLVRGQHIATTVSASYDMFSRLEDLFTFSGVPTEGHTVAELETALNAQIEQLKNQLVDEVELKRIKTQLQASEIYERDSIFYQGMKIGILETVGLNWQLLDQYLDNISQVTAEQVRVVARKYLTTDRLTVGVLDPQPLPTPQQPPQVPMIGGIH
ncbi:MAG: pitrilysin family protein [Pseudomonadota bacterium]|nr:pitrilysin family protein [Pseudomonadota bacterium]